MKVTHKYMISRTRRSRKRNCYARSVEELRKPWPWLRRILPLVTTILLAAVVYDGSIFYSRWRGVRDSEKAQALAETQQARKTLEMLGGDRLHIMSFYATP